MAANPDIFHDGEITYVMFEMFKDGGNKGQPRCVRAPFSLVKSEGDQFLMPSSWGDGSNLYGGDAADEAFYQAREDFGFVTAEMLVLGEHEMGDFDGQPDNWKGVHAFSLI